MEHKDHGAGPNENLGHNATQRMSASQKSATEI